MEIATAVIIGVMIITVIIFAGLIAYANLTDSAGANTIVQGYTTNNETQKSVNGTTQNNLGALTTHPIGCIATVTQVWNQTGDVTINSGNYTVTNCNIRFSSPDTNDAIKFNNTLWRVHYSHTYTRPSEAAGIRNNMSHGYENLFNQMPIAFTILGIVVLILAIILIVVAVQRIRVGSGYGGGSSMGGGENMVNT